MVKSHVETSYCLFCVHILKTGHDEHRNLTCLGVRVSVNFASLSQRRTGLTREPAEARDRGTQTAALAHRAAAGEGARPLRRAYRAGGLGWGTGRRDRGGEGRRRGPVGGYRGYGNCGLQARRARRLLPPTGRVRRRPRRRPREPRSPPRHGLQAAKPRRRPGPSRPRRQPSAPRALEPRTQAHGRREAPEARRRRGPRKAAQRPQTRQLYHS